MNTMDDIIAFVADLIEKGMAYESEGDVYFITEKFEGYGKLSDQRIEDLQMVQVIVQPQKMMRRNAIR